MALLIEVLLEEPDGSTRVAMAPNDVPLYLRAPNSSSFSSFLGTVLRKYYQTESFDANGRRIYVSKLKAPAYSEPDESPFLVSEPYGGECGETCPGCGALVGKRHGVHCVVND